GMCVVGCLFFFFFSSRRRHTRCLSDWSSDVCSSDLSSTCCAGSPPSEVDAEPAQQVELALDGERPEMDHVERRMVPDRQLPVVRSEERRVGKEGGCRGSREQAKEKARGGETVVRWEG